MKNLLVVVDIQNEYITEGRPYFIKSIKASLENAAAVLNGVRAQSDWAVAHIEHRQEGDVFGLENQLSNFVKGFEPKSGESVFRKSNYSCFSNESFLKFVSNPEFIQRVVIGYGSTKCCLATLMNFHKI